jgi:predicted nucleic acid-binding protein
MNFVLDTNIVSFIINNYQSVINTFDARIQPGDTVLICPVVWFEVRRGLLANNSVKKMRRFEVLLQNFVWQDYGAPDWELAAQL